MARWLSWARACCTNIEGHIAGPRSFRLGPGFALHLPARVCLHESRITRRLIATRRVRGGEHLCLRRRSLGCKAYSLRCSVPGADQLQAAVSVTSGRVHVLVCGISQVQLATDEDALNMIWFRALSIALSHAG